MKREIKPDEQGCWLDADYFEAILDRIHSNNHVSLTFDDGNLSDYEIVLPALLRRKMKARFFICAGRIGKANFLDIAQVREMRSEGMEFGSHGIDHRPWRNLGRLELQQELLESREVLSEICHYKVDMAACPFGSYDWRVLKALRGAGYRLVFTSDGGSCSSASWLQARNTIRKSSTMDQIDEILNGSKLPSWRVKHGVRTMLKRFRPPLF